MISTEEDLFYKGDTVEGILMTIDTNIVSELMNAGYSVREAADIQLILNTLGITTIRIENMSGIPSSGLNAVVCYPNEYTDRGRRFYFTTEDGVVFYAGFRGEDLYDTDRGGFLKSYDEVHVQETSVDLETYTLLQGYAIEAVKPFLSYPSSADFKLLSWGIGRSDDRYKIIGKVSAKNSFGVKRDIPFGVWFMKEGDGFMIEGIVIDSNRVK